MNPITFNRGILRFYMKGEVSCEHNLVQVVEPSSILWFIPTGHTEYQLPLNQIASVVAVSGTKWLRLILSGIVLFSSVAAPLGLLPQYGLAVLPASLVYIIPSLFLVLLCLPNDLVITTTAGQQARVRFTFFERGKAALAARQLNQMIANRMDDTNVRIHTDRVVDAINRK